MRRDMFRRGPAWRGIAGFVMARHDLATQNKVYHRRSDMGFDGFMRCGLPGLVRAGLGLARLVATGHSKTRIYVV